MTVLNVSYAVLWALVIVQAVVLREILRDTVWVKRMYEDHRRRRSQEPKPHGLQAPEFELRLRGSDRRLTHRDLPGGESVLLFMSPGDRLSRFHMDASIHGLAHKVEGRSYLIWEGEDDTCGDVAAFAEAYRMPLAFDPDGRVARAFLVSTTPSAVLLDEQARVAKYGRLLPGEGAPEEGQGAVVPGHDHAHDHAHDHDHAHAHGGGNGAGGGMRPPTGA